MLHPISGITFSQSEEKPTDSYQILNSQAFERRIQRCVRDALGQNSLQGCGGCDSDNSCGMWDGIFSCNYG